MTHFFLRFFFFVGYSNTNKLHVQLKIKSKKLKICQKTLPQEKLLMCHMAYFYQQRTQKSYVRLMIITRALSLSHLQMKKNITTSSTKWRVEICTCETWWTIVTARGQRDYYVKNMDALGHLFLYILSFHFPSCKRSVILFQKPMNARSSLLPYFRILCLHLCVCATDIIVYYPSK